MSRCASVLALAETLVIESRFNGPPDSGNGGYTCGLIAERLGEPAEVSLRQPPPLERELSLERDGDSARLCDGDQVVAEAALASLELEPPDPPSVVEAEAGALAFPFRAAHPFPSCFVCGPRREDDDGMDIFAGPLEDGELHAAAWTPTDDLAGDDGFVRPRFVWAALDCPTSTPVANPAADPGYKPIVLARLTVRRLAEVRTGEPHVITSWRIETDGRKRHSAAAVFTEAGERLAYSRALWIELRESG